MKISRVKTEKYHNWQIDPSSHQNYFKKGFWKKYDRKKFIKKLLKFIDNEKNNN